MTFSETYLEERLIDRRSRGRKARIAGRIIGFCLMACLLVAIRTSPELRAMVDDAAIAVIEALMPEDQGAEATAGQEVQAGDVRVEDKPVESEDAQSSAQLPQSTVKIHRGGIIRD